MLIENLNTYIMTSSRVEAAVLTEEISVDRKIRDAGIDDSLKNWF